MRNIGHPFASHLNFLDPQSTKDGKPYGPYRYKNIVKERYYISKNTNISYTDTGNMTPLEREYIMEFVTDDLKKTKEMLDKNMNNSKKDGNKLPVFNPTAFDKA